LVVSLAGYNEPDPDGLFPTKMAADINNYSGIINCQWLESSTMIILFTKLDIFYRKLQSPTQPTMKDCWPAYNGHETNAQNIIGSFIVQLFLASTFLCSVTLRCLFPSPFCSCSNGFIFVFINISVVCCVHAWVDPSAS
jgi:hypothetical protein